MSGDGIALTTSYSDVAPSLSVEIFFGRLPFVGAFIPNQGTVGESVFVTMWRRR